MSANRLGGFWLVVALNIAACASQPPPAPVPLTEDVLAPAWVLAPAHCPRHETPGGCAPNSDGSPAEPTRKVYEGLARSVRCERELRALMCDVTESLGVSCSYCHLPDDFVTVTPKGRIANWMA